MELPDDGTLLAIKRAVHIEATTREAIIDAKMRVMMLAALIAICLVALGSTAEGNTIDVPEFMPQSKPSMEACDD